MTFEESKKELQRLLKPFTKKSWNENNIKLARLTFPLLNIPDDVDDEQWKMLDCDAYAKDRYMVSSWGRIFDVNHFHYPYSRLCDKGYVVIAIEYNDAKTRKQNKQLTHTSVRIHRLIGIAFIDNPLNKETINHIDLDKRNNTVYNLEWMTNEENVKHAVENNAKQKSTHVRGKYFTKEEIDEIRLKHKNGASISSLTREYNKKDNRTISDIVKGISYNDDFWDNLGFNRSQVKYYKALRKNNT